MKIRLIKALGILFLLSVLLDAGAMETKAQQANSATTTDANKATSPPAKTPATSPATVEDRLKALEEIIERQQREIQALRELVETRKPDNQTTLAERKTTETTQPQPVRPLQPTLAATEAATPQADTTQKKVDELYNKFGAITVSGDLRFRHETFFNQGFDSPDGQSPRNRQRVRARLAIDGTLNKNFTWGFKFATGTFTDPISSNQTLTDFYERKPFALERMFVAFDSKTEKVGVQLIGGKFEPTFRRTQMVWDDDLNVEGMSEAVYFKTATSLKQVKLVAFQLPFNEVSNGKDGVLYGGQAQTDWQFSPKVSANFNVAYYDWVRADQVFRGLGASAFQVNGGITNGAGVSGGQNGALGTTNRLLRDDEGNILGFVANFNLFDVLGNLTWQAKEGWPVTFTVDFVRNLSSRIDDEKTGYWTGVQVGQSRQRRDWLFGYAFARIEQDAVLVPFNFSDILASNSRTHMPTVAYQLASKVTLQWNGLFSQRVNKIFPLSPVNRWLNRYQFDVIYKF